MYECFICGILMPDVERYFIHLKCIHNMSYHSKFFQCTVCPQSFQNIHSFRRHLLRKHSDSNCNTENINSNISRKDAKSNNIEDTDNVYEEDEKQNFLNISNEVLSFVLKLYGNLSLNRKTANQIITDVEELLQTFITFSKKLDDIKDLKLKLVELQDTFKLFNTEYKFQKYLKSHEIVEDLNEYVINKSVKIGSSITQSKGILLPIKTNIIKFLQTPGVFVAMKENEENIKNMKGISNIIQGSAWKGKMSNFENKNVIPYMLYQDDVEINNPLGSKAGVHKISALYLSFPLLPYNEISKLENFLVCCITKTTDICHGYYRNLKPLIQILKRLEEEGLNIKINNTEQHVYLVLSNITGDNLGLNGLLGFVKSFSANFFCRICNADKSATKKMTSEDSSLIRTENEFNIERDEGTIHLKGIKEACAFNIIDSFI